MLNAHLQLEALDRSSVPDSYQRHKIMTGNDRLGCVEEQIPISTVLSLAMNLLVTSALDCDPKLFDKERTASNQGIQHANTAAV